MPCEQNRCATFPAVSFNQPRPASDDRGRMMVRFREKGWVPLLKSSTEAHVVAFGKNMKLLILGFCFSRTLNP